MGDLLQRLLNEVVVTPYDSEVTSRLASVCDEMTDEVSVGNIDRYIASFVFNKPDLEFKKEVEDKYAESYPEEKTILLPPLFAIVLAQYITIEAITNKLEGRDQATASLILMNYMLYRKGSLTRLILPTHIAEMYYKLDEYIKKQDNICITDDLKHTKEILSTPDYLKENYNNDEVKKEVRQMAKMAVMYKRMAIVDKYRGVKRKNVYVKLYEYLNDILEQGEWVFLKDDVKELLSSVVSDEEQKKQATIEGIVSELIKAGVTLPYETLEDSSLLLKYVQKTDTISAEIRSKRLTVMEFGIYVYYELLLERIIGEYYGS